MIPSSLFLPIFQAAIAALALEQREPLSACLHYIRDVVAFGGNNPPSSGSPNPPEVQHAVQQHLLQNGEHLVKAVLTGMMITFPSDCFAEGSAVLLDLFNLLPQQTTLWVDKTVRLLPQGTVSPQEIDKLMLGIRDRVAEGSESLRKVRSILQDFTNSYRRRYVAPREGLGNLEATRFRFNG